MAVNAVPVAFDVHHRTTVLHLDRSLDLQVAPLDLRRGRVQVEVAVGQGGHGLEASIGRAVLQDGQMKGFQVVFVASPGRGTGFGGVVPGVEDAVEHEPVGFGFHNGVVDEGPQVALGLIFPVVVAHPIAVEIYPSGKILVGRGAVEEDRGVTVRQGVGVHRRPDGGPCRATGAEHEKEKDAKGAPSGCGHGTSSGGLSGQGLAGHCTPACRRTAGFPGAPSPCPAGSAPFWFVSQAVVY